MTAFSRARSRRRAARTVLLNPGPVNLHELVRRALTGEDMCHREPDACALLADVRRKAIRVSGGTATHSAVVLTGSGTSAVEATLCSVVPERGRILILTNGHFGERMVEIARIHGLPAMIWDQGWGSSFDLDGIARELDRQPSITHVAVVHHETSTGQLNDVGRIGRLVRARGRSLVVDAVSSLGGEHLDVVRDEVDWCVTSSNKCIEAPPGLAFVIGRDASVRELEESPDRSLYLSLKRYFKAQVTQEIPLFTPAMQLLAAASVALDLLLEEGVSGRHERYRRLAERLREGLVEAGLELYLPDPDTRSSTSTNVTLPAGMTFEQLRRPLRAGGFVVYACNPQLPRHFRVANMGTLGTDDIERFLAQMRDLARHTGPIASLAAAAA